MREVAKHGSSWYFETETDEEIICESKTNFLYGGRRCFTRIIKTFVNGKVVGTFFE
jgi:hypothetical protein